MDIVNESSGKATRLIVRRTSERDVRVRSVYVSVDQGPERGFAFGDTAEIRIAPGEHVLRVTNRLTSKSVSFSASEGDAVKFMVANRAGGCLIFFAAASGVVASRVSVERIDE